MVTVLINGFLLMNFQLLIPLLVCIALIFGCDSTKDVTTSTPPSVNELDIPGKLMVLLDTSVQPRKLEKELSTYELESEGQISRAKYQFMFSFNPDKIDADKLIEKINALSYASEATIPQKVNK